MPQPHLEPCGCGRTPRLSYDNGRSIIGTAWHREYVKCECGMQTKIVKRPGQAVKIWNRRPPPKAKPDWEDPVTRAAVLRRARELWNEDQFGCSWSDDNREHYIIRAAMELA